MQTKRRYLHHGKKEVEDHGDILLLQITARWEIEHRVTMMAKSLSLHAVIRVWTRPAFLNLEVR